MDKAPKYVRSPYRENLEAEIAEHGAVELTLTGDGFTAEFADGFCRTYGDLALGSDERLEVERLRGYEEGYKQARTNAS